MITLRNAVRLFALGDNYLLAPVQEALLVVFLGEERALALDLAIDALPQPAPEQPPLRDEPPRADPPAGPEGPPPPPPANRCGIAAASVPRQRAVRFPDVRPPGCRS